MDVRIVTLKYSEGLCGFPEEDLKRAITGREVLDIREHFFEYGRIPHMAMVVLLGDKLSKEVTVKTHEEDPELSVPERLRGLYREIRHWRNEKARQEGIPSYMVLRNAQIAEICQRLPRSLASLKEIPGIGEGTCAKYGKEVLSLIPEGVEPEGRQDDGAPAAEGADEATEGAPKAGE